MAVWREPALRPDVRAYLAEHFRELADSYYPDGTTRRDDPAGWLRHAARLDRGEPLVVTGWQLPLSAGVPPNGTAAHGARPARL